MTDYVEAMARALEPFVKAWSEARDQFGEKSVSLAVLGRVADYYVSAANYQAATNALAAYRVSAPSAGLEPPGCPTPGACSCPGGEAKLAQRLAVAQRASRQSETAPVVTWTLADLRGANIARQAEWCPDQQPDLSFRGNELAGETGEACNVVKKLERERQGWAGSRASKEQLAEELADVVICSDLTAMAAGVDLYGAVRSKFNATSEKIGLQTRLATMASVHRQEAGVTLPVVPDDLRAQIRREDWRDINSAPRDGRIIFVTRHMDTYGWVLGTSRWDGARGIYGWISRGISDPPGELGLGTPTHWRPLPAPPAAIDCASREGGGDAGQI